MTAQPAPAAQRPERREDRPPAVGDRPDAPTLLFGRLWEEVETICRRALGAYTWYCEQHGLVQNLRVALDLAMSGALLRERGGVRVGDLRPVLLEGPCCNGVPACLDYWSGRALRCIQESASSSFARAAACGPGLRPMDRLISFLERLGGGSPRVALVTAAVPDCIEPQAHRNLIAACRGAGIECHHVAPRNPPEVRDGALWVEGRRIDLAYRCVERRQLPGLFGECLGRRMIEGTPRTIWNNPLSTDDLRSKSTEERVFRSWEEVTGLEVSRPRTYLREEVTRERVRDLLERGGCVAKSDDSTGGRGVTIHIDPASTAPVFGQLYGVREGLGMSAATPADAGRIADAVQAGGGVLQELRLLDARPAGGHRLVYDYRLFALFDPAEERWSLVSGYSRVVRWQHGEAPGNTLVTNLSQRGELAALFFGAGPPEPRSTGDSGILSQAWRAGARRWPTADEGHG